MQSRLLLSWDYFYHGSKQYEPISDRPLGAVYYGFILLAMLATKIHKQMRKQTSFIVNGREKG